MRGQIHVQPALNHVPMELEIWGVPDRKKYRTGREQNDGHPSRSQLSPHINLEPVLNLMEL